MRNLERAVDFYRRAFGFEEIAREFGRMAFLRAAGSENHHDLGLIAVGPQAPSPPRGATGLYHLARERSPRSMTSRAPPPSSPSWTRSAA